MDNENGKVLVQAGKSCGKHHLKAARKRAKYLYSRRALLPARIHSTDLPAPDELLIKRGRHLFPDGLSGLMTERNAAGALIISCLCHSLWRNQALFR